jgi:hypothetical protein
MKSGLTIIFEIIKGLRAPEKLLQKVENTGTFDWF